MPRRIDQQAINAVRHPKDATRLNFRNRTPEANEMVNALLDMRPGQAAVIEMDGRADLVACRARASRYARLGNNALKQINDPLRKYVVRAVEEGFAIICAGTSNGPPGHVVRRVKRKAK